MGRYFQALSEYTKQDGERSIFLAGGIIETKYDWQQEMTERLSDTDLVVLNPRRNDFPKEDPYATTHQIKWEYDHLRKADMILFWFPSEAPCMTSLFELGTWSCSDKLLFVGIESGYVKRGGMIKQLALVRPDMPVVNNLEDLELLIKGSI
jgi:hypothetical protein